MTNEERDQTIDFILNQQAQLTTRLDHFAAESTTRISSLEQAVVAGIDLVNKLTSNIDTVVKVQTRFQKQMNGTRAQLAETNAGLAETRERLDAFILVLERYISEGRNGKPANGLSPTV